MYMYTCEYSYEYVPQHTSAPSLDALRTNLTLDSH